MGLLSVTDPYPHTYMGKYAEIQFAVDEQHALRATVDTGRLHMRSVTKDDLPSYAALLAEPEVMSKYIDEYGKTTEEIAMGVMDIWVQRWRKNDPYSAFAVFSRPSNEFLGHVVLEHGETPGQAKLEGIAVKDIRGQGYGTEAAIAVVKEYSQATVLEKYSLGGKKLNTITATALSDNAPSLRILEILGMHEDQNTGGLSRSFSIGLHELSWTVLIRMPSSP